jgi:hypothetical protein
VNHTDKKEGFIFFPPSISYSILASAASATFAFGSITSFLAISGTYY